MSEQYTHKKRRNHNSDEGGQAIKVTSNMMDEKKYHTLRQEVRHLLDLGITSKQTIVSIRNLIVSDVDTVSGGKNQKLRDDVKDVLDLEMSTEDTETKIRDLVITKLTDLSAPDCSHITKFLSLQDLLNLRVTCFQMFNMVMADKKLFLQKVVIALHLKDDDFDVIRKFPLNPRVYFPLEIRLREEFLDLDKISVREESFMKDFKSRICDVDFTWLNEKQVKQILPEVAKHTLYINYAETMTATEISNIINERASCLKHLYLSDIDLDGVIISEDLPHLRTLSVDRCNNDVMDQIISKIGHTQLHKLEIRGSFSVANISYLINKNAHSLKHLHLHFLYQDGIIITEDLSHIKTLSIDDCSFSVINQIITKIRNTNLYKLVIMNRQERLSAAHISYLINKFAHSLKHLHLCFLDLDGVIINEELSHLKTLYSYQCSDALITQILTKIENSKLTKLKIGCFNKKLSAAIISSLINNNSDSLNHLHLDYINSNEVTITKPLQIASLELKVCDSDVVIKILNKCANTLQHLSLFLIDWNLIIPPLSKLNSLELDNKQKDITDCKILTEETGLEQLDELTNLQ